MKVWTAPLTGLWASPRKGQRPQTSNQTRPDICTTLKFAELLLWVDNRSIAWLMAFRKRNWLPICKKWSTRWELRSFRTRWLIYCINMFIFLPLPSLEKSTYPNWLFLAKDCFNVDVDRLCFTANFAKKVTARSTTQWTPVRVLPKGKGRFWRLMFLILENGTEIAKIFAAQEVKRRDEESLQGCEWRSPTWVEHCNFMCHLISLLFHFRKKYVLYLETKMYGRGEEHSKSSQYRAALKGCSQVV